MTDSQSEKVSLEEAARRLNLTENAVLKRIHRGKLPAIKEKGRWLLFWPVQEPDSLPDSQTAQGSDHRTATGQPEGPEIALLRQEIAHLKERLAETQQERDRLAAALDKAQSALLNQQSLSLPGAVKEMQALPTPEETKQRRPWWQVWKR